MTAQRLTVGLLLLAGGLAVAEFVAGRWLTTPGLEPYSRIHPYLMRGQSYLSPDDPAAAVERPEVYGYRAAPLAYLYDFDRPVFDLAERWNFLFQDRVALANAAPRTAGGPLRIFALGGSVAFGLGASAPDRRWYARLEGTLSRELGRAVSVIPAAMPGYVTAQERLALDLAVLPRRPDVVIFLDGYNDAALPAMYGTRPGDPFDTGFAYKVADSFGVALVKRAAEHSRLARAIADRLLAADLDRHRRAVAADARRLATYARSVAAVYADNVATMLTRCAQAAIPCVAFLQPVRSALRVSPGPAQAAAQDRIETAAYAAILARLRAERVDVHDLSGALAPETLFYDPVHFGDEGHRRLAEAMAPTVIEQLRAVGRGRALAAEG